jgi:hypothetical protein
MTIVESAQTQLLAIFESGVARSTAKLSAISGMNWNVNIISLDVGAGERFRGILARDKREFLGVYFSTPGERYAVMLSEESGKALLKAGYPPYPGAKPTLPSMESATLAEYANIFINGFSGEIADRQGMVRIISGPTTVWSTKAEIYKKAFGDLPTIDDMMVNVLVHISSPDMAADCTVLIRIDSLSANFLLNTDPDARPVYLTA